MKNSRGAYPAAVVLEKDGHGGDKMEQLRASGKALRLSVMVRPMLRYLGLYG